MGEGLLAWPPPHRLGLHACALRYSRHSAAYSAARPRAICERGTTALATWKTGETRFARSCAFTETLAFRSKPARFAVRSLTAIARIRRRASGEDAQRFRRILPRAEAAYQLDQRHFVFRWLSIVDEKPWCCSSNLTTRRLILAMRYSISGCRRGQALESRRTISGWPVKHAVEHEHVKMQIQVQRRAEPLNRGDVDRASSASTAAFE